MLSEKLKYYKVESIARGSKMVQQRTQNTSEALERAKEMDEDVFWRVSQDNQEGM